MKRVNSWIVLSLALVFALLVSMSAADVVRAENTSLKIGFVDIGRILSESKAAKNARAIYQKEFESKKAMLKEKADKVLNLEKVLKNTKQDSPAWKEKREKLAQDFKELKRMESDSDEELKKKDAELTQKILVDVQQIMKQFSKSENYSIIFERKAALITADGLDVTDNIIKLYDAQKK